MNYIASKGLKLRMVIVLALLGAGALGIVARAVDLMILDSEVLKEIASRQHVHTREIKMKRGDILDVRGEPLAVSMEEAQLYVRPGEVEDEKKVARLLASELSLKESDLLAKLRSDDGFVWLDRSLSLDKAEKIEKLGLKGVGFLPASRRKYPGGPLAAHLVGFTGLDGNGLEGLEYGLEDLLAGEPIRVAMERDARGNQIRVSGLDEGPDKDGKRAEAADDSIKSPSAALTIMRPLQFVVERELEAGIRRAQAKSGCVVAMDPRTGDVLAMASYPGYDPNDFGKYSQENYRNLCVTSVYEPGSTFKAFTIAAALEEGVIRENESFFAENGSYVLGGETINDTSSHGWMTVGEILAQSSNIGAAKIGERLGPEVMYSYIRKFGFGEKTGIDFPGEARGILRPAKDWSRVAVGTIAFGQGVAVTPLQMTAALCALANGGVMNPPRLVDRVIYPDGSEEKWRAAGEARRVVGEDTAKKITGFMEMVVSDQGTGKNAHVPGYAVAGKTGTAQKVGKGGGYAENAYVASFMGFLPAGEPRLAMIVVVDEPIKRLHYGGQAAAPVFQAIAAKAMNLLKVPSEDGATPISVMDYGFGDSVESEAARRIALWEEAREYQVTPSGVAGDGTVTIPELRGLTLRGALVELESLPLLVRVEGSGIVTSQDPPANSRVYEMSALYLGLEDAP